MAMTYDEIVDIMLIEAGQFIAGLDATMLNKPQIETIIKRELKIYSRYYPKVVSRRGLLKNGYKFTKEVDGCIPKNITKIEGNVFGNNILFPYSTLPTQMHQFNWRYENGTLYTRHPEGIYDYSYITDHEYENDQIDSLDANTDPFLNMLTGRFMMVLGRSRRAFVLSELPFSMDSDHLYSEGKELYDDSIEYIKEHSAYWLAIIA